MYIYIHIYVYIHTHTHIYIYIYIYTYNHVLPHIHLTYRSSFEIQDILAPGISFKEIQLTFQSFNEQCGHTGPFQLNISPEC
jgi:hypothetical protein